MIWTRSVGETQPLGDFWHVEEKSGHQNQLKYFFSRKKIKMQRVVKNLMDSFRIEKERKSFGKLI